MRDTDIMCASYGLQITAADAHYAFNTLDERASTEALEGWLVEFAHQPAKPTGVHARNLNPIIRERSREVDGVRETRRTVDLAWWKLWIGAQPATFPAINARVEGLVSSGAWSGPLTARRALVPATEYHEKGHTFRLPEGLFAFAGLYNVTKTADDDWMLSYAIVTQPAVPGIAAIHDRMPLIVTPERYDVWLDPNRVGDQPFLDEVVASSHALAQRVTVD